MQNLAIIPARSGSKGLKDKNIRLLDGKPMLAYTIEAARESKMFSHIHVSTDSGVYADIATEYGAEVPFLRSKEYATDIASTTDVIRYVIDRYKDYNLKFDTFAVLQPTSPLRTAEDIKAAYRLFIDKSAKSVVSVCEADHSPLWMNTLSEDLLLDGFLTVERRKRRQELPTFYRINGAIYISDCDEYIMNPDFYHKFGYAYVMDKRHSIDIDDTVDFKLAEVILQEEKLSRLRG